MCLGLDQTHCDLPTPLAQAQGEVPLLVSLFTAFFDSFFLMDFIFCRLSLLGFVHRWIRKKLSLRWDLDSRSILEKKVLAVLQFEKCSEGCDPLCVTILNCKDLVHCDILVLKYVLLKGIYWNIEDDTYSLNIVTHK